MEEDYLPAQMSNSQTMLMYGVGGVIGCFVLATWVMVIIQGLNDGNWFLIGVALFIFLITTLVLLRWFKDGGVPDTGADHLKYMTFGNVIGMMLICIGVLLIMYAKLPRCDPIPNPSAGRSSCTAQAADKLGPVADGTSVCHLSCNIGYGYPNADATAYQMFQSLTCQEDGTWSATPNRQCQPVNCQAFPTPTGGLQITPDACTGKDPISALSYQICTFSCTTGTLDGSSVRVCGADGMWSGQDASCK
jgi:hypothetical protein